MGGKIVVGIDFGTTFTGVAWACSESPSLIKVVGWEEDDKIPNERLFDADMGSHEAIKFVRHLILDEKDIPGNVYNSVKFQAVREAQKKINWDPIHIVASCLRLLWSHSINSINRDRGLELLEQRKFHVVMTIPSTWPDYAKHRLKEAAQLAGFLCERSCTIDFVVEPEAALLATVKDVSGALSIT